MVTVPMAAGAALIAITGFRSPNFPGLPLTA